MALSNGDLSAADVAAVVGNGSNGFGWNDGGSFWIIVLFIFAFMNGGFGGWGNGFGGNGGSVPYVVNDVQNGFDQAAIMSGISGINTSLANAEVSRCNQLANLTNQISNLAMNQATNSCENRAAVADLKYTVATEACADLAAVTDALQSVLNTVNSGIQNIKDQMCQDKIDAKNEQIAALQQQLTMSQLAASQNAQTAAILANNEAQTAALEQYLAPTPRPAYVVPSPYCCNQGYGYGCGCGSN